MDEPADSALRSFHKRRPLATNALLIVISFPLVSTATLVVPYLERAALKQGLVFNVAYDIIRVVASWLASLYTSFWFVQMSAVARHEGAGQWTAAGGFVILGTIASFVVGILTMLLNFVVARPLLLSMTPVYVDPDVRDLPISPSFHAHLEPLLTCVHRFHAPPQMLVTVALSATMVMGLYIPARVMLSNTNGIMLAQSALNVFLVVPAYAFVLVAIFVATFVIASMFEASGCEAAIRVANASAGGRFNSETFICPTASSTLVGAAWTQCLAELVAGLLTLVALVHVGRRRGYFREYGWRVMAYATKTERGSTRPQGLNCSLYMSMVTLRSVLNNTRDLVTPVVATRMGIVDAAVINFFESVRLSYQMPNIQVLHTPRTHPDLPYLITALCERLQVSSLSYQVPNICSMGLMTIGSHLLGAGRRAEFKRLVRLHEAFAVMCALDFLGLGVLSKDISLEQAFVNVVDSAVFTPVAESVWPAAIIWQPLRALVGVYGPILMGCQGFVEWGLIVTGCFFLVYLPLTLIGGALGSVQLLVWANVAYNLAHFAALILVVHLRMLPRIMKGESRVEQVEKGAA